MELNIYKLNQIKISSKSKEDNLKIIKNFLFQQSPKLIITFNLDFLRISNEDDLFKQVCQQADLVVPDGYGVISLLKKKYKIELKRTTGHDIFQFLLELSSFFELRYAFVGSSESVLKNLKTKIQNSYPNLKSSLFFSPGLYFEKVYNEEEKVIQKLKEYKPDILFLALGCPRQEFWLKENMYKIKAKINIGIGGVFDVYSGKIKRAPIFIQNIGLEWFWRLLLNPIQLFKRYMIKDLPFFLRVYISLLLTPNRKSF